MIRKIIHIDEEKCNGCGLCASTCHEGAIEMVDGKAKLVRENFCDGFGDCLPACPTGAITFEEREAPAYDEAAVKAAQQKAKAPAPEAPQEDAPVGRAVSRLKQWPCQIKLLPAESDLYDGADILLAADCTAYAYANLHEDFMKDRITLIGCPKLDMVDYTDKLTDIFTLNDVQSVTLVRMQVPCCGGLQRAAAMALENSGKGLPFRVVVISHDGRILSDEQA